EVLWKKQDEDLLLLLYQEGDILTESTHDRFKGRVEFFSAEDRNKGNFSMRLKDVRTEDKGLYICSAFSGDLSDNTTVEVQQLERLIVSGAHVISAYVGEEITLNCSVDSHIPSEKIEEVSWKKQDEDLLLLLYQEGDILTESTHGRFKDRVEFFSAEDRNKGNFSMRLKDVRTEDKGLYICSAFSGDLSDNTTVEVQQLGKRLTNVETSDMMIEGHFTHQVLIILTLFLFSLGFRVQGPSGPLTVQLGDSVMLPCFVETPLPMEELEVEWKRNDSGSLVHLWQNGESRPESQNQRYHERAHFFSEEVAHGNFSLLLTNVTREDAGVYKCVVHTNQHSDKTLIEIMETERLVVSGAHVISAYVGEEITLNCSVDSHIPSEKIEEVSWKKQDEDLLLLLYQEGDILTESTHDRFKGRVEFFSAEDRNKGNFSMRLKDVRIEDKGLYICSAFSGTLSDNTTVEVQQLGFHVQGPSGPLTVHLGDSVMLPCFVETPLPMEELEVEWKRTDSGSLVHLWQNGESPPESQNQRYNERAHFFSEEVAHGNFSLLLTNVTREDAGVYKCVVHTNQDSDETLIKIMETERLIVSGAHVISAYVGEEITLNCSVDSHIPSEKIEEVSWKKQDEDLLLLLYQEGDILTESTHGRFKDRVEFFSAEDRNKGNFSMRLKDVRTEDKGLYICSAISGTLSDNTTVEVQQLSFHVQGPSGPLTVQLGGSVMLPCFVETPPPMEFLEVAWKRTNCGSLVHLWQNGESRPESQNRRYHERAHFFSEEVAHGNFSLLLTNVTREDTGVYKCVVHTNQ
ncbi:hypothetical protein C0J45_1180, partial [Silurus meridionalis]